MRYLSTRDSEKKTYSFSDVLLQGLAPDGGLFVPERYPILSSAQLQRLRALSYPELATEIISIFVGDSRNDIIPAKKLNMFSVFVNYGYGKLEKNVVPDLCIQKIIELKELV